MTLLQVQDICKNFGGLRALDKASLGVEEATVVGLIGPNGSGKTTMINVIAGHYEADSGRILFQGKDITDLSPHQVAQQRLVRSFQVTRVFPKMTVMENMLLAPREQAGEGLINVFLRWGNVRDQEESLIEKATEILHFLEIERLRNEYASNLSGGQQKLLELGRCLMSDPLLVLLDEPVAGVNPTLATKIFDKIRNIRNEGTTFLVIEHNMDIVMNFCEEIYVLTKGKVVAKGSPSDIQENRKVIDAYLGG